MAVVAIKSVSEAAKLLQQGELVVYPTESSYALGCDAGNRQAVAQVYALKERDKEKPLPAIVDSLAMAARYVSFSEPARVLAEKHWPGPLTLVLPRRQGLAKNLNAGAKTLGVRASANRTARQLAKLLGRPIVSTSANVSGQGSCYSPRAISRAFCHVAAPVYLLDRGTLPRRQASTVALCDGDAVSVLRSGPVKF